MEGTHSGLPVGWRNSQRGDVCLCRAGIALQAGGECLECSGRARELAREICNRLRIDLALVPLLDYREIRAAGLPVLAALPAMTGKVVRGRCQHVRRAAQQVAAAVAVKIDR